MAKKSTVSVSGRGEEIIGQGIDTLFGGTAEPPAPAARRAVPAAAPSFPAAKAEEVLDAMLSEEALAGRLEEESEPLPASPSRGARPQAWRPAEVEEEIFVPAPEEEAKDISPPKAAEETPAWERPPVLAEETAAAVEADEVAPVVPEPEVAPPSDYRPPTRSPLPPAVAKPSVVGPPPEAEAAAEERPVSLRIGGILMDVPAGELAMLVPPGPGEQVTPEIEITPREYTEEEQQRILAELTRKRRNELMEEVDKLYDRAATRLASHQQHSATALKLLYQSRTILIERPYAFADAELRMQTARTLINRTEESRKISGKYWPRLLLYEAGWALLLFIGLIFEGPLGAWIGMLSGTVASSMPDIFPVWGTMLVGGIGGVICALWSMWWHVSDQQDYDPQYNLWYMVQPIQGMVLGIIVYLIIAGGFLAMQTDISSPQAGKAAQYFPWLIAAIAGIRQTFVYELLDRIIRVISPRGEE
ncbi:MAG: hypothetical protein H8D78_10740 [Chloroflexi bacterium]|nr:hypothetical protein [Chloroflexota bacterium]